MMNHRLKTFTAILAITLTLSSCMSYNAYQKARTAEVGGDWDAAVVQYQKALEIDPSNTRYKMLLDRAKRESSRAHFEKGKSLFAAASAATGGDQLRLAQLAATELELTVRLDATNQFAAVEFAKATQMINDIQRAAAEQVSIDEVKKRAQSAISKAQPPQLNPASNEPISLTFSRETPVKDIYRALGNAFGINIVFDQGVKDDRITIELRDVTAQQALERVMQAANHFYKTLDEKTIIIVPDNPQARRDYEDLVIRTFYLSNGDAEQVTNVVRTMIEARNVFPLKALNAITIRDTADKVRIAEKIIEANDKARAEVVVQVELLQMDISNIRDLGFAVTGVSGGAVTPLTLDGSGNPVTTADGKYIPFTGGTLSDIARSLGDANALRNGLSFTIPAATYSLLKTLGNSELLANPELRISEGEKATLHIGQRIPVPVTTISGYNTGNNNGNNLITPYTSFQYQDVGIKVAMEPRVHHNREVTLKLTVEVSNQGAPVEFAGQKQPTFTTRTIESTIRLKDGETNFLAGLIRSDKVQSATKTPILGDLPFIGRLFTNEHKEQQRTDLMLTMTPHIIRIPDITVEDVTPMWVGTGANLTFRGVSPRIESQAGGDPFAPNRSDQQFNTGGLDAIAAEAQQQPATTTTGAPAVQGGSAPTDVFRQTPANNPPEVAPAPRRRNNNNPSGDSDSNDSASIQENATVGTTDVAALRLSPRVAPQPSAIALNAGEVRVWEIVGMDLDGLQADQLLLHYNPRAMTVADVALGTALSVDPMAPPVATVDPVSGTIRVRYPDARPLSFVSGGQVLAIRVQGGDPGETYLVLENPELHTRGGEGVVAAITGGKAVVK
jgi:general secretion pathway protein D